ncbi:arylsulfatase [Polaribacter sp.]|uniref:sulfatase family protein n=1 Tax=Polaribacter sp. TaxID=1920175 RepID=UPI0026000D59|nr:arylsulfatase [Polaribacter sp.]
MNKLLVLILTVVYFNLTSCKSAVRTESTYKNLSEQKDSRLSLKPNIVYILCDVMGYGDIQALGGNTSKIPTPNVDSLISQGLKFTDAHSSSSVCTPTRYGILKGRYAWRTYLQKGVLRAKKSEPPLIDKNRLTVASFLKDNGPHHAGSMKTIVENNKVKIELESTTQLLLLLTAKAIDYINENAEASKKGKPFFLYVALTAPHTPIVPTKEWQGKSGINAYGDFVMQTDWTVGQILKSLDKNNLADNTLVVFTSDNVTSKKANIPELESYGHYSSAGFRGRKTDIWDGGHRIPFIVRWPKGGVEAGSTNNQLICLTDLLPTCADILKTPLSKNKLVDAQSFYPALQGNIIPNNREAIVHHSIFGNFAIRKGKWKLIFCSGSGGWSKDNNKTATKKRLPKIQLYDMESYPNESKNLQGEYPEVVKELKILLEKYVADGRSTPGKKLTNDVPIDI